MRTILIIVLWLAANAGCFASSLLFTNEDNFELLKKKSEKEGSEQYKALARLQKLLVKESQADPFVLEQGKSFTYGWCAPSDKERNISLKNLTTRMEHQSAFARDMAQLYLYTGNINALNKAIDYSYAWATQSTVFNAYLLGMDTDSASFPGMVSGFCNRPWNMMLDGMWQTYGLINFSQVLMILEKYPIIHSQENSRKIKAIRSWLKNELLPGVNASFHAWTKWADSHPTSRAYKRYRNDNHLSWCLAGLAAAAVALNDEPLMEHIVMGTDYDDGISGSYSLPSNLLNQIDLVIDANGEIFDEKVRDEQGKGFFYANFSLWALTYTHLALKNADFKFKNKADEKIEEKLRLAMLHYAPYVSGEKKLNNTEEKTDPSFFSFTYKLFQQVKPNNKLLIKASNSRPNQNIIQGLGDTYLTTL